MHVQSVRLTASSKTCGRLLGGVSRVFKNAELCAFCLKKCLFWHFIPYILNVYLCIICLFQYFIFACILTVFIILQPL